MSLASKRLHHRLYGLRFSHLTFIVYAVIPWNVFINNDNFIYSSGIFFFSFSLIELCQKFLLIMLVHCCAFGTYLQYHFSLSWS